MMARQRTQPAGYVKNGAIYCPDHKPSGTPDEVGHVYHHHEFDYAPACDHEDPDTGEWCGKRINVRTLEEEQ